MISTSHDKANLAKLLTAMMHMDLIERRELSSVFMYIEASE